MEIAEHSRKLFIKDKNRKILILSTSSDNPEFKFIKDYAKACVGMKSEEVDEKLKELTHDEIAIFNDLLLGIIKNCQEEWAGNSNEVQESEMVDIPCSLCGTKTRWVYLIENRFNGKVINVGSTCIDQFIGIEFHKRKSKKQIEKEVKNRLLIADLVKKIPGIEEKAKKYNNRLKEFPILIPKRIKEGYLEISMTLEEKYEQIFEKNKVNIKVEEFQKLVELQSEELNNINEYVNISKEDAWIVTREMVDWLLVNGKSDVVDRLEEVGYVTHELAHYILEKNFVTEFAYEFNILLDEHFNGAKLIEIDIQESIFKIKPFNNEELYLDCPIQSAINYYGWAIFMATERMQKQPTFILSNLFYMSKLTDELSLEIALKRIKTKVTSELSIKLYHGSFADDYSKSLEITGYKKDGKISVLNFNDFIHEYRKVIVSSEGFINKDIKSYIQHLGSKVKHYSASELKDLREASKEFNR